MNITFDRDGLQVAAGYDRQMDYAFLVVSNKENKILYSNLYEPLFQDIQNFDYFVDIAKEQFDLDLLDIADAVDVFKINTAQPIEKFKERLKLENLDHLIEYVRY